MKNAEKEFDSWCEDISENADLDKMIQHFRIHIDEHFKRYNNEETGRSLENWIVGILNFSRMFEKKFYYISAEDKLYKMCKFYKKHPGANAPSFDCSKYMDEYKGEMD